MKLKKSIELYRLSFFYLESPFEERIQLYLTFEFNNDIVIKNTNKKTLFDFK